jgi:hypothetical protein
MTGRDVRHGTYGGAQKHRRLNEPVCAECLEAQRDYKRDYRSQRGLDPDKWWNKTHQLALRQLAREYPERFAEVLAEVRREQPSTPWDAPEADARAGAA